MAKDLVRTRNYITRFIEMKTHLNAVSLKMQVRLVSSLRVACPCIQLTLSSSTSSDHQIPRRNGHRDERSHQGAYTDEQEDQPSWLAEDHGGVYEREREG